MAAILTFFSGFNTTFVQVAPKIGQTPIHTK
jgi:hypothetical protein